MIVRKVKSHDVTTLALNENEDIEEVESLEYIISVENKKEYDMGIEFLIEKAIDLGVDVFQYTSNAYRLQHDCNRILSSHDLIIVIETNDKSKFQLLEELIKWFIIKNKYIIN